ncbi:hypothetical protein [Brevibacillus parabrevis]|uniref:hypothetical protein n=1 Tax=Brevibacillus parabrevis TaxID=54914 RepID=UPI003D1D9140
MSRWLISLLTFLFLIQASPVHAQTVPPWKAAFVREGNLWLKIDQEEKQITTVAKVTNPVWSYDGQWIAYIKNEEIWVYDMESKKEYHVYHKGATNLQWAPDKNVLAFQDRSIIDISDIRFDKPKSFKNVAVGVDNYSWMPDGSGFLVSSSANLLPDGWTNPILYKVPYDVDREITDLEMNAQRFFVIPSLLRKGNVEILSIGTSSFKWSPDQKWITFIVNPTASWSADSDMLCALSADGKRFIVLDEMLQNEKWFQWAPQKNVLAYIQGGGRILFGFKNKNLTVTELPVIQSLTLTPKHFVDLDFTWERDDIITVSRAEEREWSNDPSKHPLPSLYLIRLNQSSQDKITIPPAKYGDYTPYYVQHLHKLTWIRSNQEKNDVWIAEPNGEQAKMWIQNIDFGEISWPKK